MNTLTICWIKNHIKLIDQMKLPTQLVYVHCRDLKTLWRAIKELKVRGAPAIGVAGAFGALLGANQFKGKDVTTFKRHIHKICDYLGSSRPTAVNLFHALNAMRMIVNSARSESVEALKAKIKKRAFEIYEDDRRTCRQMGKHGAALIKTGQNLLTVCNAGALATVDYGTALGVMYAAKSQGKKFKVFACETRPLLQGARLTAWELLRAGVDTTLICDNMAATLMKQKNIDCVFTGADRIASNGDTANKIGTYSLAVLAKHHGIPFYIVAPRSTFDMEIKSGRQIPIEQRSRDEVIYFGGHPTAPKDVKVYNPAFDVTDAKLISGIITEKGIIRPPFGRNIGKVFRRGDKKKRTGYRGSI